ncbi:MAG: hypothetical protein KC620_09565 [Myxococcales bacterium]|nr:hypothetical protein [Myxococcales bacterium]
MAKRQKFKYSCGAASLINAAYRLGMLDPAKATDQLEEDIYYYSSHARRDNTTMPSGIIDACHYMHEDLRLRVVEVQLNASNGLTRQLEQRYPKEKALAEQAGVHVSYRNAGPTLQSLVHPALPVTSVALFVVQMSEGLHWLLWMSPHMYLDPDDGQTYVWFKGNTPNRGYRQTGITVILNRSPYSRPAAAHPGMLPIRGLSHNVVSTGPGWV